MIRAYHIILSAYGFWLPNDPRGSWSDFVGAWELLRFGKASKVTTRKNLAYQPHDQKLRAAAKAELKYPPVLFNGQQARGIASGFAEACAEGEYSVLACSILPDHAHLILERHRRDIGKIVGHLKSSATKRLIAEGLHPLGNYSHKRTSAPCMWARNYWKVYIDNDAHLRTAIAYVQKNPLKEGKRLQHWNFVQPSPTDQSVASDAAKSALFRIS
jgi:REP element-mobilizing transposase RayT